LSNTRKYQRVQLSVGCVETPESSIASVGGVVVPRMTKKGRSEETTAAGGKGLLASI
jgi:hypothetical protein